MTATNDRTADFHETATNAPIRTTSSTPAQDFSQWTNRAYPWQPFTTDFKLIVQHTYAGKGTESEPFLVTWLPESVGDPENPLNFPNRNKWTLAVFASISTFAVALASSAYSGATRSIKEKLGGSREEITLGLSLFVLAFALGPLLWAPLSEVFGRRNLFLFTYAMFTLFNAVAASSQTLAQLLVFRFLAGTFGSSPLSNAGGTIADTFDAKQRGLAMTVFASAPFTGPTFGPVIGGFIGHTNGGFRWVQGFLGIFTGVLTAAGAILYTETYAPLLLRRRAAKLSKATGQCYVCQADVGNGRSGKTFACEFLASLRRPWLLLIYEPIVLLLSLYMAIVYAILYSFFGAFPIVFQQIRGWSPGVGGLAFVGILVGEIAALIVVIYIINPDYVKQVQAHGGLMAPPEVRLKGALYGAPMVTLGIALFACTNFPSIHWSVCIILSAPFGFGMVLIMLCLTNYLVDSYLIYAASVLAASSVIRSVLGAAFPMFTAYMYHPGGDSGSCPVRSCGIHVGPSIAGAISILFLPAPFLFYKRCAEYRKRCRYAAEADKMLEKLVGQKTTQLTQTVEKKVEEGTAESV